MDNPTEKKRKVLVVDDEKALANALRSKLQSSGYEVKAVYGGEEAITEVGSGEYELMLLDILMPGVDGWKVLSSVNGKVKVIITSNLGQEEDVKKAKSLGATDFLIKSENSLSDIVDKVKLLLE